MSFGTQSSSGSSSNKAFDFLKSTYGGQAQGGAQAQNALGNILGLNGDAAQGNGFQNYLNSAGYKFNLGQGQNAITSSNAASGLLNSGSAIKGLAKFGQGLASNYLQQYLASLQGASNTGLQAGSLIGNAGQTQTNKSSGFNFGI